MRFEQDDWPTFGWIADMRPHMRRAREQARPIVLATLVKVTGPSPRPAGTQMMFDHSHALGYFSGGCVEADVAIHAEQVLQDGEPRRLVYGQGSPWIDIRLLCGGTLEIALERILPNDFAVHTLLQLTRRRQRARWLSADGQRQVTIADLAEPALTYGDREYAVCYDPPYRVIVVGKDPFALAMASLSASSGFETTLVFPNGPSAPPPLPRVTYLREQPATVIAQCNPDPWTAVVSATHDDELDDLSLLASLRASTGYVGVLGSAKRIALRRERLLRAGIAPTRIAALHAPIGLGRCGKSPWDVAVSVMAEIMQTRTDQSTFSLHSAREAPALRHDPVL